MESNEAAAAAAAAAAVRLAVDAITCPAMAERWPQFMTPPVAAVSRRFHASLVDANRTFEVPVADAVQSVAVLETTLGLGLPRDDERICREAARAGHADVLARAEALGCPLLVRVGDDVWRDQTGCWAVAT